MDKVHQRSDRVVTEPKKFLELADRSSSRDNCILSEFMLMRDAKFSKVTTDNFNDQRVRNSDGVSRWSQQSQQSQQSLQSPQFLQCNSSTISTESTV